MRRWRQLLGVAMIAAAFAACDLNPQPLPPGDDRNQATDTPTGPSDSSGFGEADDAAAPTSADAGGNGDGAVPPPPNEGGVDGGDDASDASDSG